MATSGEVAQALLEFAEQLEAKPIQAEDVPAQAESEYELRRVKRRPGRRHLASFENLPVTTQVYELRGEQRVSPAAAWNAKRLGRTRVGRSSTFLAASSVFSTSAKSMLVWDVRRQGRIRRWR